MMKTSSPRCDQCNKKVGLLGQKCKCERVFCISHLHAEEHNCTFDYRAEAKENLKRSADKLSELSVKLDKI
jgi:AN1-type zinc finger protein 5/6